MACSARKPPAESAGDGAPLQVLHALTGRVLCDVEVDRAAPLRRLSAAIAAACGVPVLEQRLVLPGPPGKLGVVLDCCCDDIVGELLGECASLLLVRVRDAGAAAGLAPGLVLVGERLRGRAASSQVARWAVDAAILESRASIAVCQIFQLRLGELGAADFRIGLAPSGAFSFREARGRGKVQLKCLSSLPAEDAAVEFGISVNGIAVGGSGRRHVHNFAQNGFWRSEHAMIDLGSITEVATPARGPMAKVVVVRVEVFGCDTHGAA